MFAKVQETRKWSKGGEKQTTCLSSMLFKALQTNSYLLTT